MTKWDKDRKERNIYGAGETIFLKNNMSIGMIYQSEYLETVYGI